MNYSNKISLDLEKSIILDLYSGTGSFGLECLSRNSKYVYFVENNKVAFEILEKNIEKLKMEKKTKTFFSDVFNLINKPNTFLPKFGGKHVNSSLIFTQNQKQIYADVSAASAEFLMSVPSGFILRNLPPALPLTCGILRILKNKKRQGLANSNQVL